MEAGKAEAEARQGRMEREQLRYKVLLLLHGMTLWLCQPLKPFCSLSILRCRLHTPSPSSQIIEAERAAAAADQRAEGAAAAQARAEAAARESDAASVELNAALDKAAMERTHLQHQLAAAQKEVGCLETLGCL